jgi:hypothetical protein
MMSDKPYYHEDNQAILLRAWVLRQMTRGAGWAALVVGVLLAFFLVLKVISGFLPAESKQAPSPYSYLEQSVTGQVRVT